MIILKLHGLIYSNYKLNVSSSTRTAVPKRPYSRGQSRSSSAATLGVPPYRPRDARAVEVNPGQIRQRL